MGAAKKSSKKKNTKKKSEAKATKHPFYDTLVTPEAPCVYQFLSKAHDFEDKGEPKYKITLQFTEEQADAILEDIDSKRQDASDFLASWKKPKHVDPADFDLPACKEVEDDDGNTVFEIGFKVAAENKDGDSQKPIVVDAAKHPVTEAVGTGSRVKVAYRVSPYPGFGGGFSLRLLGVQVLSLQTYGGDVAGAFGEEDGGFQSAGGNPEDFTQESDDEPYPEGEASGREF